jgi:uncharacterized membrane protein
VVVLVAGLILFLGVHSLKAIVPAWRKGVVRGLGEGAYKGIVSFASLAGFALIIWGFSRASAETGMAYSPPAGLRHLTFALMLPALVLAIASVLPPGRIRRAARHPLLVATALWAVAHLIVNGALAAVVLFGAFLAWALMLLARQPWGDLAPLARSSTAYDIAAVLSGLALYGALVWRLHEWAFGVSPGV